MNPISPKVTSVTLAGALTTVIVGVLQNRFGITLSGDEAAAVTMILTALAGYLTPHATLTNFPPTVPAPPPQSQ